MVARRRRRAVYQRIGKGEETKRRRGVVAGPPSATRSRRLLVLCILKRQGLRPSAKVCAKVCVVLRRKQMLLLVAEAEARRGGVRSALEILVDREVVGGDEAACVLQEDCV